MTITKNREAPLEVTISGEVWKQYSINYKYNGSVYSTFIYSRDREEAETMLNALKLTGELEEGELVGFSDKAPTEEDIALLEAADNSSH